jgi:hypothetical protein
MKVTFTKDDLTALQVLFLELCFAGKLLPGAKFGGVGVTAYDLLHNTSPNSLEAYWQTISKQVEDKSKLPRFRQSPQQQARKVELEKWANFLELLIGYKLSEAERNEAKSRLAEAKAEMAALKELTMTPQDRLDAKQKEIDALMASVGETEPASEAAPSA